MRLTGHAVRQPRVAALAAVAKCGDVSTNELLLDVHVRASTHGTLVGIADSFGLRQWIFDIRTAFGVLHPRNPS